MSALLYVSAVLAGTAVGIGLAACIIRVFDGDWPW